MKDEDIKHARLSTTTEQPDGSLQVETKSFYEKLARVETEIEKNAIVPLQGLLKELIECTDYIVSGSGRVHIELKRLPNGYIKVTKRWLTGKQVFDRR